MNRHGYAHTYRPIAGETPKTPLLCIRPAATLDVVIYMRAMVDSSRSTFTDPSDKFDMKLTGHLKQNASFEVYNCFIFCPFDKIRFVKTSSFEL